MNVSPRWVCGRCGEDRWSSSGVCPSCGNEAVVPRVATADHTAERNVVSTSPPWLLLLVGGLLAIVIGQLLFGRAGSLSLPFPAVAATLLGISVLAAFRALSKTTTDNEFPGEIGQTPNQAGLINPSYQGIVSSLASRFRQNDIRLLGPVISLILIPVLLLRIWGDQGSGWDLVLWIATIAGFASVFAFDNAVAAPSNPRNTITRSFERYRTSLKALSARRRQIAWDFLPLLAILAVYCAIAVPNLTAWRYSAIGDEYIFYEHARQIFDEGISRPFSQDGVYGNNPHLNTIYKSAVMAVFGDGHFGWKFVGMVSMIVATTGIYVLGYSLANRRAAIVAAVAFTSSHYLLGLLNGGYNHLDALPVAIWAVALFVLALRRNSPMLLYVAGVAIGLGLYFHYSGRIIGPVILLLALSAIKPRQIIGLWPAAVGLLLTAWPTILVAREEIITKMLAQSVGVYSESVSGPVVDRLINNLLVNLPAFHFNISSHTYVAGPLADPISAALATMGIAFAIGAARQFASRLMLIWLAVAFVATGLIAPYPTTAITRLFPLIAPLSLLAGTAANHLLELAEAWCRPNLRRVATVVVLPLLLAGVLILNTRQSWDGTHDVYHYTQEALAIGAQRHELCDDTAAPAMFVGERQGSTLDLALYSYGQARAHRDWLIYPAWPGDAPLPNPAPACVILVHPDDPETRILVDQLQRRYPHGQLYTFTTPSGKSMVEFFKPNGPA